MKSDNEPYNKRARWIKIIIWLICFVISGFYITSALGWFAATYMASAGMLNQEVTIFWQSLSTIDQVVRTSQVILIVVASLFLIFCRRIAVSLFLVSLLLSLFSTVFADKWGISFLAGPSVITLAFVCCYTYWISRRGFLHPIEEKRLATRSTQSPIESTPRELPRPKGMKALLSRIVKQMIIAFLSCVLILGGLFFIWYGISLIRHLGHLEWWSPQSLWLPFGVLMILGGIKLLAAIKNP